MKDSQRLFWNVAWQLLGKAVTVLTSVFIIAFLTRYLTPAGFGDYTTIFAYLGIFLVLVDLGFFVVSIRIISREPALATAVTSNLLYLKLFLGFLVFGLSLLIASLLPSLKALLPALALASFSQMLAALSLVPVAYLQARLLMPLATISDVAGRLLNLALVLVVVVWGGGLEGAIGAVLGGNLVLFLLNLFWTRAVLKLVRPDWSILSRLWREALPLGMVLVLSVIYFRIDAIMLYWMKGREAAGFYGVPYKVLEVLLVFPTIFGSSVLALLSRYLKESREKFILLFQRSFQVNTAIVFPVALGLVTMALPLTLLISGEGFLPSAAALKILALALIAPYLSSSMIYALFAAGEQKRLVVPYLLATTFNVIGNLILIPRFSFLGAAWTTVFTEFLVLIFTALIARNVLRLWPRPGNLFKPLAAGLFMWGVLGEWSGLHPLVQILLGGLIYLAALVALRGFDLRTLNSFISWRR